MQCEVYDVGGRRLEPTSCEEAFTMLMDGRGYVIAVHPTRKFRTINAEYDIPIVIGLRHSVNMRRKLRVVAQLNKHNLFLRDSYRCQYCGRHESELNADSRMGKIETLTRDHVFPRDLGGINSWENLVTACSTCNSKKGNKTLDECGLVLAKLPYAPLEQDLSVLRSKDRS